MLFLFHKKTTQESQRQHKTNIIFTKPLCNSPSFSGTSGKCVSFVLSFFTPLQICLLLSLIIVFVLRVQAEQSISVTTQSQATSSAFKTPKSVRSPKGKVRKTRAFNFIFIYWCKKNRYCAFLNRCAHTHIHTHTYTYTHTHTHHPPCRKLPLSSTNNRLPAPHPLDHLPPHLTSPQQMKPITTTTTITTTTSRAAATAVWMSMRTWT